MGSAVAIPNSLIASGTLAHVTGDNPAPYPVRLYMQETNKFRWEEDLPEGPVATVINGEKAQSQSVSATDSLAPWQVGGKRLENFPMFLLARWLNANSTQATFVGQETIDGQMRNHISVVEPWQQRRPPDPWRRDGNRGHYEIWIDPVSSLPARLRYYQDTDDAQLFSLVPMEMLYSDFHNIGAPYFPSL